MKLHEIITKMYLETGPIELHMEDLMKLWDERFFISGWNVHTTAEYTLCVYTRHKRPRRMFKARIHNKDAERLIKELKLVKQPVGIFRNARTWRKDTRE